MGFTPIRYTVGHEKVLETIATNAFIDLDQNHKLNLHRPDVAYTITVAFLQECAEYIKLHPDTIIDIHDIIRLGTEVRESEEGEKEGNITPWVELPSFLDASVNDISDIENYTKGNEKELEAICKQALIHLKRSNELNALKEAVVFKTAAVFIKEISEYLRANPGDTVEISSIIKFRVVTSEDESGNTVFTPIAELGELFKLGVKDDDDTEEDDEDDED